MNRIPLILAGLITLSSLTAAGLFYQRAKHAEQRAADQAQYPAVQASPVRAAPSVKLSVEEEALAGSETLTDSVAAETANELEARLRAKDGEIAMLYSRIAVLEDAARTNAPDSRPDRRSWMDDMRENDPERYKEFMERRETARQEAKYEVAKKAAFFLDRDRSMMSEDEAAEYEAMMSLLTDTLALTERLEADLPRDERWEIMRSFRENLRDLGPMLDDERGKEFYLIGKDMGYTDDDAAAFAAYLEEVVDLTSVQSIFRNSMRAMGGRGGGGGGPPPGGER